MESSEESVLENKDEDIQKYEIREFDLSTWKADSSYLIIGRRREGKSHKFLLFYEQFLQILKRTPDIEDSG